MTTFQVTPHNQQGLSWPNQCALCGNPSTHTAKASCTTTSDVRSYVVIVAWTYKLMHLAYPVCRKHRFICRLLDEPSRWSFIQAGVMLVLGPCIVGMLLFCAILPPIELLDVDPPAFVRHIIGSSPIAIWIVYMFSARFLKPVRVSNLDRTSMLLSVRSPTIASALEELNAHLLTRVETSKN